MVLIITGCINPNRNVEQLKICDKRKRLDEYINSLVFYIKKSDFDVIIFCENSNYVVEEQTKKELCDLADRNKKIFEWLRFQGNEEKTIRNGKGYGEGEILQYAISHSKYLREGSFAKVTGRVIVKNINIILKKIESSRNYFNPVNWKMKNMIDTKFYIVKMEDYLTNLQNAYLDVNDKNGIFLEHLFCENIKQMQYTCMPIFPCYVGSSGSTGASYSSKSKFRYICYSIFYKVLYLIQTCLNYFKY